jgi:hypothetical protein
VRPLPSGEAHILPATTWEVLFADPTVFNSLPAEAQNAIYEKVAALEARFRAQILARSGSGQASTPDPDRAIRIDQACDLLGMSKDFLYRHWEELGGYRDDDGHVKFTLSAIQRHLRQARPT